MITALGLLAILLRRWLDPRIPPQPPNLRRVGALGLNHWINRIHRSIFEIQMAQRERSMVTGCIWSLYDTVLYDHRGPYMPVPNVMVMILPNSCREWDECIIKHLDAALKCKSQASWWVLHDCLVGAFAVPWSVCGFSQVGLWALRMRCASDETGHIGRNPKHWKRMTCFNALSHLRK